jgi:hypothetical protein
MFGRIRPFRKRVAAVLVQVGEAHGFKTQEDIAACLGVSDRTVRNWVKCRQAIDFEKVAECEPLRVAFFDAVAAGERAV